MKSRTEILNIIKSLLDLFEKDKTLWSEITDIFTNLSQIDSLDEDIRSFCMDAMIIIGESMYKTENVVKVLASEYKKLVE